MTGVRMLGEVVDGVQQFESVQKFETLTDAYQHLLNAVDQFGYALAVTNLGFPWCNRQGKIVAYIEIVK